MLRKTLTFAPAAALVLCSGARANDLLDFYHVAQEQDQTLQAALFQRDASIEAHPQALSYLLPQITGTAGIQRTRDHELDNSSNFVTTGSTTGTTTGGTAAVETGSSSSDAYYYTSKSYQLNLSQALFDWPAFETLSQASKQVAQAEATYRSAEQSLIYRTADAYFTVLNAQDALRADLDAQASYLQQQLQAQKKFEVGLAAITDVRNAQASYDTASATVIADQRALDSARRSLGQIIGKPVNQIAGLQDEIPLIAPNPASEEDWTKAALQDNPDLMTAFEAAEVARKAIDIYRGQYLPTLSLQGSVGRQKTDEPANQDSITDAIGLSLNWNIFQGGLVTSQVRQATASYKQALAQYESERRVVNQGVRDAYEGVVSGIASVKANRQAVLSNQTSLQASQVGLKVGTRTEVDVLTAQQALATAQRAYFLARYDFLRSVLSLKQQAGRLGEGDLAELDRLMQLTPTPPRDPSLDTTPKPPVP